MLFCRGQMNHNLLLAQPYRSTYPPVWSQKAHFLSLLLTAVKLSYPSPNGPFWTASGSFPAHKLSVVNYSTIALGSTMDRHFGSVDGDPMEVDPRDNITGGRNGILEQSTGYGTAGLPSYRAPHSTGLSRSSAMDLADPCANSYQRYEARDRPSIHDVRARSAENRFPSQPPFRHESPAQARTEEWLMQRLREEAEAAVKYLTQNLGPGLWAEVAAPSNPFRTPYTMWLKEGQKARNEYDNILRGLLRFSVSSRDLSEMQQALQQAQCLPFPTAPPKSDTFFSLLDKVDGLFDRGCGRLGVTPTSGNFIVQHAISGACTVPELLPQPSSSLETYFSTPDAGLAEKLYDIYIHLAAHVPRARWETRVELGDLHKAAEQKLADLQSDSQQMKPRTWSQLKASPFIVYLKARVMELETVFELDIDTTLELEFPHRVEDHSQLQDPLTECRATFAHIAALEYAFHNGANPVCTTLALATKSRDSLAGRAIQGILKKHLADVEYVRHPLTTATHPTRLPNSISQRESEKQGFKYDTQTGNLAQPSSQSPPLAGGDGARSLVPSRRLIDQALEQNPQRNLHIKAVHFSDPLGVVVVNLPEQKDAPTPSSPSPIEEELHIFRKPTPELESKMEGSLFDTKVESEFEGRNASAAREWFSMYAKRTQPVLKARRNNDYKRIRIAVLDTGIDLDHPIIAKCKIRIANCRSWVVDDASVSDTHGHGTHIASVLLKLAPSADLYVARVFKDASDVGNAGVSAVVNAINHARTEWKVDIISLSFGYRARKPAIEKAINDCASTEPPILIFAAAANTGAREDRAAFPARMGSVFCINSASGDGAAMSYNPPMHRGRGNLTFLGDAVTGAWPVAQSDDRGVITRNSANGPERVLSGTSLAAPVAAAVAATVLELCRQRPRVPELSDWCVARVQTYDGMDEVFRATMKGHEVREYMLIQPWELLDAREGDDAEDARLAAGKTLASAIRKEFGT
ncbi:hypothetical protein BP5796_12536 [Coleophoma crateriformis]|uniref:Peptidase S8/S53 domain-containing protein n=1 Tax=Coleophoma crateriformis TaxID=565419 RepID=A0A3D8Q7B8_9HELO|nr:hypothetical protein BP5796_12536 [Coleophoma crateriformis]